MKGRVTSELRKIFRPKLLNRIDEIIVFHKLEREDMRRIIEIELEFAPMRLYELAKMDGAIVDSPNISAIHYANAHLNSDPT